MPPRSTPRETSEERDSPEEANEKLVIDQNNGLDEDDSDEDKPKKGGGNQGRRKIDIEFIEDKNKRHITFSKRKAGIMKKAYELSTLTGTQVLLLVVSETGLVYTYTTPKLSTLVMAREGKNLIQKCLTVSGDGQSPTSDYPDPKVKHYAGPRGQKVSPPSVSYPASPTRSIPPASIPNDAPAYPTNSSPGSMPPVSAPASNPYFGSPAAYHPHQPIMSNSGMHSMPITTHAHMPASTSYDYTPSCLATTSMNNYGLQQRAPIMNQPDYGYVPLPPMPTAAAQTIGSPSKPSLKKRKTVENIKKANQKDLASAKMAEATEGAARTLEIARNMPTIENLLRAFTMQDEAHKSRSDAKFDRGVSATMTELHMAINHNLLLPSGSIPDLSMSSPAEQMDSLYAYFFQSYMPTKNGLDRKELQNYASDLIALAGWMLGHSFIQHNLHIALIRHCASAKLTNNQKNTGMPSSPQKSPMSRQRSAIQMLADYSVFASERYHNHWEQSIAPITGHFSALAVAETFLILDEAVTDASQEYISTLAPFKLRMPSCLNRLLKRGDSLHLTIRKAQGSSFWLPVASGDITLCLPDAMLREYDPQPDRHRYEMEQCQAAEDQVGFTIAFTAYQKATRGDALLSMGEFDDEGFRPRDLK